MNDPIVQGFALMHSAAPRLTALALFLLAIPARSQDEPPIIDEAELPAYLEDVRRQMVDDRRDPSERAQLALEAAGTLDRVAQARSTAEGRDARWGEATALLDSFVEGNPANPALPGLMLQAAVYRWAAARAWISQWEPQPGDTAARDAAEAALDDAISRLDPLVERANAERDAPYSQNVRYRLARALADRVELADHDDDSARDLRERALQMLVPLPTEPSLAPLASVLKVRLQAATGRLDDAEAGLAALPALGVDPAEKLDAKLTLLLARRSFPEAVGAAEQAEELTPAARQLRAIRARAAQWISLFPGRERSEIEADAFRRLAALRDADRPEARLAAVALARSILEPDQENDPRVFELLAEGHLALGDDALAARLNLAGAEVADRASHPEVAWRLRYRAAAILFRRGDDVPAERILALVAAAARDPEGPAPEADRSRASLLQILCLGRRAATGTSSALAAYEQALLAHLEAFPSDPSASEARLRLGRIRDSQGRTADAVALWEQITPGRPRWLESRLAAAGTLQRQVQSALIDDDMEAAREALRVAREALDRYRAQSIEEGDRVEFDLARADLELTPSVGDPGRAVDLCESLRRTDVDAARRLRAGRLHAVALGGSGQFVDSEREVRELFETSTPAQLLEMLGRLDALGDASTSSSLTRRRLGYIGRQLAERVLAMGTSVKPAELAEAQLGLARARLATGDLDGARDAMAELKADDLPASLVAPWARSLATLGLFSQAADAYRKLVKQQSPGSRGWLESRYELALAEYRSGNAAAASKLIAGTEALHPELGGSELKEKYLRLQRRLAQPKD